MKEESSFDFDGEQIPCVPSYNNEGAIKEEGNLTELYIALTKARLEFDEVLFQKQVRHPGGDPTSDSPGSCKTWIDDNAIACHKK